MNASILKSRSSTAMEDRIRALHEAAHAVLATTYGFTVELMSIESEGSYGGGCRVLEMQELFIVSSLPTGRGRRVTARRFLDVLLAGGEAERIATGVEPVGLGSRWDGDLWHGREITGAVGFVRDFRSFRPLLRNYQAGVAKRLRRRWSAVEALASALLAERTLGRERVRAVLALHAARTRA